MLLMLIIFQKLWTHKFYFRWWRLSRPREGRCWGGQTFCHDCRSPQKCETSRHGLEVHTNWGPSSGLQASSVENWGKNDFLYVVLFYLKALGHCYLNQWYSLLLFVLGGKVPKNKLRRHLNYVFWRMTIEIKIRLPHLFSIFGLISLLEEREKSSYSN